MFDRSFKRRVSATVLLSAAVSLTGGCTSPTTGSDRKLSDFFRTPEFKVPWSKSKADQMPEPYPGPVKLAVTWTPDVLVQTGRTPTRGFGGRLFFFNEKSRAVPVEGTLTVHGFEGGVESDKPKVRPFKFTPEQFTRHFSQSDVGASYSIWIPWDAAGGPQKRVSLVATFQTTDGKLVQGSPTTVILPGASEEQQVEMAKSSLSPQYQGHMNALAEHATRSSGLVTTTIRRGGASAAQSDRDSIQSIAQRFSRIAVNRKIRDDGKTPFADVQLSPRTPDVMPASAEMPAETMPANKMPRRISPPFETQRR